MKRPFVWILIFLIAGIGTGQYFTPCGLYIVLFFSLLILISVMAARKLEIWEPILLPLVSIIGFLSIQNSFLPYNPIIDKFTDTNIDLSVYGFIMDKEETYYGKENIEVLADKIIIGSEIFDVDFKIDARVPLNSGIIGQKICIDGSLTHIEKPSNPGEFNYFIYAKARNYEYEMTSETIELISEYKTGFNVFIKQFKEKIQSVYDKTFPPREAGVVKSIITGDRYGMDSGVSAAFRVAGLSHVLAVSGLHISIVAMLLFWILCNVFFINRRYASVPVVIFLLMYLFFTGCSPSAIRAFIMSSVFILGKIIYREGEKYNSLAFAAVVILVMEPLFLWDPGFLMSFSGVLGVLMAGELFSGKENNIFDYIKSCIASSVMATAMVAPIGMWFFFDVSLNAIISNILVLPFMGVYILLSMVTGLVGLVSIDLALMFAGIPFGLTKFMIIWSECVSKYSAFYFKLGRPTVLIIIIYYVSIAIIFLTRKNEKYMALVFMFTLFIFAASMGVYSMQPKETEIAFLDTGQGDCSVITTAFGMTAVIDGGPKGNGNYVVYPYLEYRGINKVDVLFITHMDSDHAGGAIELLSLLPVDNIVIPDTIYKDSKMLNSLFETAKERNIIINAANNGDEFLFSDGSKIICLNPIDGKEIKDSNNGSLVLKYINGRKSFLFMGDAEIPAENLMIQEHTDMECDVLKVGHHGSEKSSSEELIKATGASMAIIQCGENNMYGHPHKSVVEKIEKHNMKVYNTAKDGAIVINTDGEKISVTTVKEK